MKIIILFSFSLTLTSFSEAQVNPVIVELFTSQGCSSCPAADRNLTEIIQEAQEEGRPVYALSFHVDYWNYIGWKDPYSHKEFTERQRHYASVLNLQSIYTPQMVVNGKFEFVGSDKSVSRKRVEEAARVSPKYNMAISNLKVSGHSASFNYTIDQQSAGEVLNIAIVERNIENFVPKGENKSKTLRHDNVVRVFKTIELLQKGTIELDIPTMNQANGSVILYIQDKEMNVHGSASIPFYE